MSGRRKTACGQLENYARGVEKGPLREMAARAWSELAIWRRVLGDGGAATTAAAEAAQLAGPASSSSALLARFLSEPQPGVPAHRTRQQLAPGPENPTRDRALACALLLDGEFGPAAEVLKRLYAGSTMGAEEGVLDSTGLERRGNRARPGCRAAAALQPGALAGQPVSFVAFYFPRLYYLRGVEAAKAGRAEEARADFKLFLTLSGPDPLIWGEEKKAQGR